MKNQEPIIAYDHLEDEYKHLPAQTHAAAPVDKVQLLLCLSEEAIVIMLFISMFLMI